MNSLAPGGRSPGPEAGRASSARSHRKGRGRQARARLPLQPHGLAASEGSERLLNLLLPLALLTQLPLLTESPQLTHSTPLTQCWRSLLLLLRQGRWGRGPRPRPASPFSRVARALTPERRTAAKAEATEAAAEPTERPGTEAGTASVGEADAGAGKIGTGEVDSKEVVTSQGCDWRCCVSEGAVSGVLALGPSGASGGHPLGLPGASPGARGAGEQAALTLKPLPQ